MNYTLASAVSFTVLFIIWTKSTFPNLVFKLAFLLMAIWGWAQVLHR